MRRLFGVLLILSTLIFPAVGHATTITQLFTFTTAPSDGAVTYSGVLTFTGPTDPYDSRAIDITSLSGTINSLNISLVSLGGTPDSQHSYTDAAGLFFADNVFFTRGPYMFDAAGLLFTDGTNLYNIVGGGGIFVWTPSPRPGSYLNQIPYDVLPPPVVSPEPSTLALCGTGLLTMALATRRKLVKS